MLLFQNGYECQDKIQLFYRLFFHDDEEVTVTSNYSENNGVINVYTTVFYSGKIYEDDYTYTIKNYHPTMLRKARDAAVTKSFCHAASKIRKINLPWGVMSGIRPAKNVRDLISSGIAESEICDVLFDLYEVEKEKAELALTVYKNELEVLKANKQNYVSLYIGIPFCPTRCLYCSFVSTDVRVSGKYIDDYVKCLLSEIDKTAEIIKNLGLTVQNIYIGGGTPTTLSAEQLAMIFDRLRVFQNDEFSLEFTLEAGRPDTITKDKLMAAKDGCVTRISINPQSMNDKTLKRIGRSHSSQMIYDAFSLARECGFDDINMDLIAGLPGECADDFKYTLDEVLKLDPDSITVHSMCMKRSANLRFSNEELGESHIMNEMLSYTQSRMKQTDRVPYYMYRQKNISGNLENVGYAKQHAMSFYNINIMEEVQTIIAMGCGGGTKIVQNGEIIRIFNFKDPVTYIDRFNEIIEKKNETYEIMKGSAKCVK